MKLAITFLMLFSTGLMSQRAPRAYFPWWESPLTHSLHLTDDQQKQIHSILKEYRDLMIDQRAAVEKAEADVQDFFNEETVNEAEAEKAIDRLVKARSEMTRTFTQLSLKLRQVLTYEQWQTLQKRRAEWKARHTSRQHPRRPWRSQKEYQPRRPGMSPPPPTPPAPPPPDKP